MLNIAGSPFGNWAGGLFDLKNRLQSHQGHQQYAGHYQRCQRYQRYPLEGLLEFFFLPGARLVTLGPGG